MLPLGEPDVHAKLTGAKRLYRASTEGPEVERHVRFHMGDKLLQMPYRQQLDSPD